MIIELDPDLESVLFEEFDAQYCRRRGDARFNADSDEAEVRSYLGTYFPRSWAEHTLIWKRLLVHKAIQDALQNQECIRILDVGSGTGGHLYAVVEQLRTQFKKSRIKVLAIDANEQALNKQCKLHERLMFNGVDIDFKLMRFELDSDRFGQQLLEICQSSEVNFDIVLSSKFLSEISSYAQKAGLNSRGFYQGFLEVADQVLSPHGIVSLVDVNVPIKQQFVAEILRSEIQHVRTKGADLEVIMPLHCGAYYERCCENSKCYMTIPLELLHRGCSGETDKTQICFRVLAREALSKQIFRDVEAIPPLIYVNEAGTCYQGSARRAQHSSEYTACFC